MTERLVYKPNLDTLRALEADGYVTARQHPSLPLTVWNYSPKTQYSGFWTPDTRACRGLILDQEGRVVARPFPKFFNLEEHEATDLEGEWVAYEKLDGTLGILFNYEDQWIMSTRGSFLSDQATKATEILHQKYQAALDHSLDPSFTYLFEIIYPENRIVVDYGSEEKLVLLGMIQTERDWEGPPEYSAWCLQHGYPVATRVIEGSHPDELYYLEDDRPNAEGYVVNFFQSVGRVKLKHETYRQLHRLVTGISTRRIWKALKDGEGVEAMLSGFHALSDDYKDWVSGTISELRSAHESITLQCMADMKTIMDVIGSKSSVDTRSHRSRFAEVAKKSRYPQALFLLYDDLDFSDYIWKIVKPTRSEVYKNVDLE